jgi:hypothetical protein
MERRIDPEWLDELPAEDPGAVGSRRDLQRLNALMGNAGTVAGQLQRVFRSQKPATLVELGAGDGRLMLGVARRLSIPWRQTGALLVDRQPVVLEEVARGFEELGWTSRWLRADALDLVRQPPTEPWGATIANLFLHHLSEAQLRGMFRDLAKRTRAFIAVEPRRSTFALAASRLVRFLGCNQVTRHDAPVSVRAGFTGRELSALWPEDGQWRLREGSAGWFSHLFVAERKEFHEP